MQVETFEKLVNGEPMEGELPNGQGGEALRDAQPGGNDGGEEGDQGTQAEDEELVVQIGNEAPDEEGQAAAPDWVRDVRKQNRELQKQLRELQARASSGTPKPQAPGEKPRLDEFDYNADEFESALESWYEKKRAADIEAQKQFETEQVQQRAWQDRLEGYAQGKAALKVRDHEDAEATVQEVLSVTQQGIILQGAENPALVVYALGKNPQKAADLAKLQDPVKFAFAVAKLEKDLKVTPKKQAPPPERMVTGTGRTSGSVDSTLDRLRAEAEKTGNYTKVIAYKSQKKA